LGKYKDVIILQLQSRILQRLKNNIRQVVISADQWNIIE